MNITLTGTKVSMDSHTLAFQKNNLVDSMVITVDTDAAWQYKLDVKYPCKDSNGKEMANVIDLTRVGDTCTAILQAAMLPFNGKYTMQLRGINGEQVYHTETFDAWVKYSIDPSKVYDPVPSEFYQIEANITELNNHPPKPSDNGYWMIWNIVTKQYEQSDIPLPDGELPDIDESTKGKYLTNDGSEASWAEVDALPSISTATKDMVLGNDGEKAMWVEQSGGSSLPAISETTKGKYLSNDGSTAEWADAPKETMRVNFTIDSEGKVTADKNWDDATAVIEAGGVICGYLNGFAIQMYQYIPDEQISFSFTDVSNSNEVQTAEITWLVDGNVDTGIRATNTRNLGITSATVGQIAKITAVDDVGRPTAWEAVDIPTGLPTVVAADNGKFLRVVNGAWATDTVPSAGGVGF